MSFSEHKCSAVLVPVFLCFTVFTCLSCRGSAVRELNESNARDIVQKTLENRPFRIYLDRLRPFVARTRSDLSTAASSNPKQEIFKRMLERGLVQKTVENVNYPYVASFLSSVTKYNSGTQDTQEITLQMAPNSNSVSGLYKTTRVDSMQHVTLSSKLLGAIEPDGKISLAPQGGALLTGIVGSYREEGDKAFLRTLPNGRGEFDEFVGAARNQKIGLNWYTFSWSPEFKSQMIDEGRNSYFVGGLYQAGEVSKLRLLIDTEAEASVLYSVTLNENGKLFYQTAAPTGTARVTFAKKPDGTWIVDSLSGFASGN
jgi:hypothetical protein